MSDQSSGVAWGNWLVSKASGLLDARLNRRSFIARTTLLGSAVAAGGVAIAGCNTPPYQSITGCPPGSACGDGYTEFCCVINSGINACPPGTMPAGWWRADGSIYCAGGTRYYIDCNEVCCGPGLSNGFCSGCSPCRCAVDCNTRKVHCNYFRYGQCNTGIAFVGPIGCRMVSCTPPYALNIGCDPSGAVDNSTANHNANCAAYLPPPPPPPPPAVLPASGSVASLSGNPVIVSRGLDGSGYANQFDGTTWTGWVGIGGAITSRVVLTVLGSTVWAFARATDNAIWVQTANNGAWSGWTSLGGGLSSDPAVVADSTGALWIFARGLDHAIYYRSYVGGSWGPWTSLGGGFTSDPTAAADASGNVWVVGRGLDDSVFAQVHSGGAWGGWQALGGGTSSDPAVVATGSGTAWVFARGLDDAIYYRSFVGGSWGPWSSLGGGFTSDPAPVVDASGTPWVFARGLDSALYVQSGPGGTWSGWQPLDGLIIADPVGVAGSSLWVFALGADHAMYNRELVGGSWTPWQTLGGGFAPVRGAS